MFRHAITFTAACCLLSGCDKPAPPEVSAKVDDRSTDAKEREKQQVELWQNRLQECSGMSAEETVALLYLGLRNMGYRRSYAGHDPSVDSIYFKIQQRLLALPGHAQYFAHKIEVEQKSVERFPTITGPRCTYDFNRGLYFEVLSHLPSPETIQVLGHFLYDDKDTPVPLISPDSDWGENPRANSFFAAATIMRMNLKNPPIFAAGGPDANLERVRAWWEEIQAGKRVLAFAGQDTGYRFTPDGSWKIDDDVKNNTPRTLKE